MPALAAALTSTASPPTLRLVDPPLTGALLVETALLSLAADERLFVQHGRLVELLHHPQPRVVQTNVAMLTEKLWTNDRWLQFLAAREVKQPRWLARHLLKRAEWSTFRPLAGLIDAPVLRPDGTVVDTPGYDASTGLYLIPSCALTISRDPSQSDSRAALDSLHDFAAAFPIESLAHRSAFVAAMLTPFARHAFTGAAPLFFFDSPGGDLPTQLADVISQIVAGHNVIHMEKPPSERVFRRRVAQAKLRGDQLILLDDADTFRGAQALRTALMGRGWTDGTERTRDPRPVTWLAASDNALLSRHVAPLVLPIRLRATMDEGTGDFLWSLPPTFQQQLRDARPSLVSAILTILHAYELAGRPMQDLPLWDGFDAWTQFIAGAIVWSGGVNPLLVRREVSETVDDDTEALGAFLLALERIQPGGRGLTIHELLVRFEVTEPEHDDLRDALNELAPRGWSTARRLGALFKNLRGRFTHGLMLERIGQDRHRYARWAVLTAESLTAIDTAPDNFEAPSHDEARPTSRMGDQVVPALTAESLTAIDATTHDLEKPSQNERSMPPTVVPSVATLPIQHKLIRAPNEVRLCAPKRVGYMVGDHLSPFNRSATAWPMLPPPHATELRRHAEP